MQPSLQTHKPVNGWNIFFCSLLTLTLLGSLLGIALNRTLFSEKFFQNILLEQNVYDQIPEVLAEQAAASINQGNVSTLLISRMSREQLVEFYRTLLPPEYIQSQVNQLLDSIFSFVNLESTEISVSVDMEPVKENIQGQVGSSVTTMILDSIPDCSAEQALLFGQWLLQSPRDYSTMPICKPPEPLLSLIEPYLTKVVQQSAMVLPSDISIAGEEAQAVSKKIVNSKFYSIYGITRGILAVLPWISLFLAFVLILINRNKIKAILSILGIPGLVSGTVSLLIFGFVAFMSQKALQLVPTVSEVASINSLANSILSAMVDKFVLTGLIIGAIAVCVGLICVVISTNIAERE